jgi:hypothetical protein
VTLKDGDIVTLDGIEMEVTHASSSGYWFKERGGSLYYYSMVIHSKETVDEMLRNGRLTLGEPTRVTPGLTSCTNHLWKKYVGARELYRYCIRCDAKQAIDWRNIKDGKDF